MKKRSFIIGIILFIIILCGIFIVVATNNNQNEPNETITQTGKTQKFKITYNNRDDLVIKEIYDTGEYKIKTFGGDVIITINDIQYSLEDALQQGLVTGEDIVEQAKDDEKENICTSVSYADGGSREYSYSNYTILKLNKLSYEEKNTNTDLIIGMPSESGILRLYNSKKQIKI